MAMKRCKECGEEISSSAKTCPKCGKKQGGIGKVILILLVLVVIIAAAGSGTSSNKGTTGETEVKETFTLTEHKGYADAYAYYIEGTIEVVFVYSKNNGEVTDTDDNNRDTIEVASVNIVEEQETIGSEKETINSVEGTIKSKETDLEVEENSEESSSSFSSLYLSQSVIAAIFSSSSVTVIFVVSIPIINSPNGVL